MSNFAKKWKAKLREDIKEHLKFGGLIGALAAILSIIAFMRESPVIAIAILVIALLIHPFIEFLQSFSEDRTVDPADAFAGMAATSMVWALMILGATLDSML